MAAVHELERVVSVHSYVSFEAMYELRADWDEFVSSVAGDIYLTFDWCHIWWKHYGERRTLRVYICRQGGKIVGILPFFFEVVRIGPIGLRIAKIVGSDFTVSMVNPALDERYAEELVRFSITQLIEVEKCELVLLGPLGASYRAYEYLRKIAATGLHKYFFCDHVLGPYSVFSLPITLNEYMATLDKGARYKFRKALNFTNRTIRWSGDIVSDKNDVGTEFEAFVRMHTEQWNQKGMSGHFTDWPRGIEFNTEMARTQVELGRLRLVRLLVNGRVVSYRLCYAFAGRWYARLPARLVGPEWDTFSLGRIGLVKVLEMAILEGVKEIEAGAGHYDHKRELGAQEHSLHSLRFAASGSFCRLKFRLFSLCASLVHLLYYRVWFIKVAPRLPLARKPLWKLWIRTRL